MIAVTVLKLLCIFSFLSIFHICFNAGVRELLYVSSHRHVKKIKKTSDSDDSSHEDNAMRMVMLKMDVVYVLENKLSDNCFLYNDKNVKYFIIPLISVKKFHKIYVIIKHLLPKIL